MTMKTHHYGIMASFVSAAAIAVQGYNGQSVNLADPVVWSELFGFIMTLVGLARNAPQPA